jgi:hypothetical protein
MIAKLKQQLQQQHKIILKQAFTPVYSVDIGNIRSITLETGRMYTIDNETFLPSITTVLSHDKIFLTNDFMEEAKKAAQILGTNVHDSIETLLLNGSVEVTSPFTSKKIKQVLPLLNSIDKVLLLEAPLFSNTLGVAGRCDLVAEINDRVFLIDFKNVDEFKLEYHYTYFLQLQAYSEMIEELTPIKIDAWILACSTASGFEPIVKAYNKDNEEGLLLRKYIKKFSTTEKYQLLSAEICAKYNLKGQ